MKKKIAAVLLTLVLTLLVSWAVAAGVVEGTWVQAGGRWVCQDSSGRQVRSWKGYEGVRIPAHVNSLDMKDFAYAERTFVIYCDPGSYAENFALSNGLQYDNGVKRVVGYNIRNVNQKANWIIENYISAGMSDSQKARVLHNWLIYNNYYDLSLRKGDIADVLVNGTGVCQAYADAYAMLLTRVGVENRTLISTTEQNHIWNVVKLGGRWVHIDATWDDPISESKPIRSAISGNEDQSYYALSDAAIGRDHAWEEPVHADTGDVGFVHAFSHTYFYVNGRRLTGWATLSVADHVYSYWAQGFVMVTETQTFYFDEDGDMAVGWRLLDGAPYYFSASGALEQQALPQGWLEIQGTYYYIYGNAALTGWNWIDGVWYYFTSQGAMVTGWQQVGSDWYYFTEDGAMVTGWLELPDRKGNSLWYYLTDSGVRAVGWQQIGGVWYYLDGEGVMATGLRTVDGATYYFQSSGAMTTGWTQVGNRWYYLKDSGAAATGWLRQGGAWYYLGGDGVMTTGWLQVDGVWYYFNGSGIMQTGTQTIDGQVYSFAQDGSWIP